ncbi:hypothetical protein ACFPAF_16815 [Hymenobacter endophyticus]|uniref:Uncharacterized protein n=1 Tax=Hymenobacter endophyticus TaxID=3076335 RepID=A0ABU3TL14_9BACT|nr:hypothetical protein [Hymenobacter endophyticus]MDU0372066.1 hypothetical protein [Hymenobacter endophyticus]
MQLDFFTAVPEQTLALRSTPLPELSEAAARVGTPEQWATLTLSQVLERWNEVYTEFISPLDGPIQYAKECSKPRPDQPQANDLQARRFYKREYDRLSHGQGQLRALIEEVFCHNLTLAIEQGQAVLRAHGLDEEEIDNSHEFFNDVIQHPQVTDLGKLLPVLMQDVAQEFLRLPV